MVRLVILAAVAVWSTSSRAFTWVWIRVSCELIEALASVTCDWVAPSAACVSVSALCPWLMSVVAADATACWADELSRTRRTSASIV